MSYRKSLSVSKVISYILLLLVLAAGIVAVVYFTDGCTKDFQTFYVTRGDKTIMERGSVVLPVDEDVRFDVKYTFGMFGSGDNGFGVKVVPSEVIKNNFVFLVDEESHTFSAEPDLTSGFDIQLHENYFTISLRDSIYLGDLLSRVYTGKTVEAPKVIAEIGYMTLVVTSYDGKSSVYVDIGVSVAMQIIIEGGDIVF